MTNYDLFSVVFSFGVAGLLILTCFTLILVSLTVDRRLKKVFINHPDITVQTTWFFRVINIALNVVFKSRSINNKIMQYHYNGFDFRSHATALEIIICFVYVFSGLAMITLGLLAYPAEYFGLIDFDLL
ncbi:hypothetical protein [Litoribacillus peritrichatus]|uniref:Uncharacterized protein n=1 Tax=Litoribacillus peritrichatus TaxID=718191 RepID=A0ABP7N736_9GAMM